MTLTDADREAIAVAVKSVRKQIGEGGLTAERYAIYLAGLAAGAERMQERCAKVCEKLDGYPTNGMHREAAAWCAAAIRAGEKK